MGGTIHPTFLPQDIDDGIKLCKAQKKTLKQAFTIVSAACVILGGGIYGFFTQYYDWILHHLPTIFRIINFIADNIPRKTLFWVIGGGLLAAILGYLSARQWRIRRTKLATRGMLVARDEAGRYWLFVEANAHRVG